MLDIILTDNIQHLLITISVNNILRFLLPLIIPFMEALLEFCLLTICWKPR